MSITALVPRRYGGIILRTSILVNISSSSSSSLSWLPVPRLCFESKSYATFCFHCFRLVKKTVNFRYCSKVMILLKSSISILWNKTWYHRCKEKQKSHFPHHQWWWWFIMGWSSATVVIYWRKAADCWNVGFRIQMMLNVLNEGFSAQCRIQMVLNAQCNDSLAQ